MANVIYRGPSSGHPRTVSDKPVTASLLPGTFVTEGATTLTQAVALGHKVRLLAHRDFYSSFGSAFDASHPLKQPYQAGETGVAYVLEPGQQYQAAMAAGNYTFGQPLTIGAAGRRRRGGGLRRQGCQRRCWRSAGRRNRQLLRHGLTWPAPALRAA